MEIVLHVEVLHNESVIVFWHSGYVCEVQISADSFFFFKDQIPTTKK